MQICALCKVQVTQNENISLNGMKGQYLAKINKLSQIAIIKASSHSKVQYYMRYLAFQNKLVKKLA